jgi:hypothetical protein
MELLVGEDLGLEVNVEMLTSLNTSRVFTKSDIGR